MAYTTLDRIHYLVGSRSDEFSKLYKSSSVAPYPVFLNSSSVVAFYHINEAKGVWQVAEDKFSHGVAFSNSRTINNYHTFLDEETSTSS